MIYAPSPLLLSAMICTYNREKLLAQTLKSLCRQSLSKHDFEVIIVDDGSTDQTAKVVESFRPELKIRYLYQDNEGAAAARNLGINHAAAAIVVSLDDDDELDAYCLQEHYWAHQKFPDENFVILAHTELSSAVAQSPLMHYVTNIGYQLFSYPLIKRKEHLDCSFFWTGRISFKRNFLLQNGLFDTHFQSSQEDIELGYRLSNAGMRIVYHQKAKHIMQRSIDYPAFCHRSYRQGWSNYALKSMYSAEVVKQLTQTEYSAKDWLRVKPIYMQVIKSAHDLDCLANARIKAALMLDKLTLRLLHRAYAAAFSASMIKGMFDSMEAAQRQNKHATHDHHYSYLTDAS